MTTNISTQINNTLSPAETELSLNEQAAILVAAYLSSYASESLDFVVADLLDCGYSKQQISEGIRGYIDGSF